MCRGLENNERERLKIKAFYLRLSLSRTRNNKPVPDSLTLHYLPRINGSPLDVDGSSVRPDSPAFVTLHRVVSASSEKPVFGSRERVAAGGGVRFDVYFGEEKLLGGVFRRGEGGEWKVECKCVLERDVDEVKAAEVWVEAEGQAAMSEKVAVAVRRRRRRGRGDLCWFQGLEEIPEEREGDDEVEGCRCCCSEEEREGASDGGDGGEVASEEVEMEIEGVRLAVDVGFWVACLGVGYLVSSLSWIKML